MIKNECKGTGTAPDRSALLLDLKPSTGGVQLVLGSRAMQLAVHPLPEEWV